MATHTRVKRCAPFAETILPDIRSFCTHVFVRVLAFARFFRHNSHRRLATGDRFVGSGVDVFPDVVSALPTLKYSSDTEPMKPSPQFAGAH